MAWLARTLVPFILTVALLGAAPLVADDHDFARRAVERGEILPLGSILTRVQRDFSGQILEVELERADDAPFDGQLIYEVTMLAPGGDVTELYYDARTGELLLARGHDLEHAGRHEREEEGDD
ncbi:PepSY domain-containing protein [Ferruginivarius sediminum]|uniref:Peptidase n=1 Tax=Ferruginivarius sediminum TaxID=2661937 RepID=A0A369TBX3_9PROT|nr:PepSY domain-containing protein [Ferruginivarius sediminum]RDD62778.1 peptidase [Ferruginivarius sediminum]